MACNTGDKPIIKYKFANGGERIYKSDFAPIEIETKSVPVEATENYNPSGYSMAINAVNGFNTGIGVVDHFTIRLGRQIGSFSANSLFLIVSFCGNTSFPKKENCTSEFDIALGCYRNVYNLNPGSFQINYDYNCPNTNNTRCSIIVKYNNLIIFKDQGDCPVSYEVQCGRCGENEIECKKSTYPGYCCISCNEVKSGISAITSIVRSINNG